MIVIEGLTKRYGATLALADLDLEVRQGEVFGLLGPNGSGKTTTIRLLLGLLRPTSGRAAVAGFDCWSQSLAVRRMVSYLPGELRMFGAMTGLGMLRFLSDLRGRPGARSRRRDRRAGDEAEPQAQGPHLLHRHEAEAGPGAGVRRPGGHPDPRRADLGARPLGPRRRARPGRRGARPGPDGDLLRARPVRGRAGRRPRRDHAPGAPDARRGHARPAQPADAPAPVRRRRAAGGPRRAGADGPGAQRPTLLLEHRGAVGPLLGWLGTQEIADIAIGTEDLRSLYDQFHGPNVPDDEGPPP